MWIYVLIGAIVIGAIIGMLSSDDSTGGALGGALAGGMGCGYVLLQIFLGLVGLWLLFKVGSWLFG